MITPLEPDEHALLVDLARGPVRLQTAWVQRGRREKAFFYALDGPGAARHQGGVLMRLYACGYVEIDARCESFTASDAGRAALAALQDKAA